MEVIQLTRLDIDQDNDKPPNNYKSIIRRAKAHNPGDQIALEIQKCNVMYQRLRLDRAVTTLGFEIYTRNDKARAPQLQRPISQYPTGKSLTIQEASRAKTAPIVNIKRFDTKSDITKGKSGPPSQHSHGPGHRIPHITSDMLVQMLNDRGLGTPRRYRYPPLPPEYAISKHYASLRKVPYYMEKLKGYARIDSDQANSKAMEFCDEQREVSHAKKRTTSALFRSRHPAVFNNNLGEGRSFAGQETIINTHTANNNDDEEITKEFVAASRIKQWIEGCTLASAKGYEEPNLPLENKLEGQS